jgi:hypothetical protein
MHQPAITTRTATRDRSLLPGRSLRVAADRPTLLRAREGMVWVTFESTREAGARREWDYFLERGQCIRLEPGEVVLVGAADARRGVATFDVDPIRMLRQAPAWRRLLARVLTALPVRTRGFAHA